MPQSLPIGGMTCVAQEKVNLVIGKAAVTVAANVAFAPLVTSDGVGRPMMPTSGVARPTEAVGSGS